MNDRKHCFDSNVREFCQHDRLKILKMLGHKFDYSLKLVIVGDSGVGKTSLLLRFVREKWEADTQPTLGVDYRGSAGALIIFDITSKDSFDSIDSWLHDIREYSRQDLVTILIGNKTDINDKRAVSYDEAYKYAQSRGISYFETSATTGENITEAISECIHQIEIKVKEGSYSFPSQKSEPVNYQPEKTKSGCSC